MGLLSLIKRISNGAYGNPANRLTNAEVDNNWQQIIDLFPTPASGNTDVGKTVVLNSAKTGFDYVALPNGGVQSVVGGDNVSIDNTDPENPIVSASGVQNIVAGTNITVDNTDPENPIVSASGVQNIVAGTNITVDNTDPENPIVSASGVQNIVAGTNITVDNTDPENPIVSASGVQNIVAGTNITVDNTDPENPIVTASFTQQGKYLISGGISWSGTGLVYDVSTLEYFFNGNKTSTATQVTLGASDPSNNRFDVVVVNEAGVVSVIQGTASASPEMPPIPETELIVSVILVEAGSVAPTILSEAIYLDDPTTDWTFSTYTTGSPTGTIIFNGTTTPKQGIHCIEANADQRLGARFVRSTSFDAYQYSMFSVWVRFTSAVAPNNALNVRFENSGGSLVGNTVNLFNFGLQRNIINTWQLVVIPLTSFGSLPSTVKGFRTIMTGGTIGLTRQWDIDYMHLTNGSIPYANVPTIAFQKDGVGVGSASTLNIKEGANMTITPSVNPISGAVEYEFEATPGGGGSPAGSNNQIQINQSGTFFADSTFQKSDTDFNVGLDHNQQSAVTFTGSGLDDLNIAGTFSGTVPTTYTATIDGVNVDFFAMDTGSITGGSFAVSDVITNGTGGTATILSISVDGSNTYLRINITAGSFSVFDVIDNGSGVTATIGTPEVNDTYTLTDGTTTLNYVPALTNPNSTLNGIKISYAASTGHTLSDSWTWTYSTVNQNVLDFSNNDYKFQSTFGTDTFSYQISDNLLGYGIKGAVNTWVNGSDFLLSGAYLQGATLTSGTTIQIGSASAASLLEIDKSYTLISDGTDSGNYNLTTTLLALSNTIGGIDYGIEQLAGTVTIGNLYGGNGTKITIDDINEHITIRNLPAYDDDTAAGVGGLTAGMIYMTTGSGSAPLNAAGILMIKQ